MKPDNIPAALEQVVVLHRQRRYEEAIDLCTAVIERDEDCYAAYSRRSYSNYALGRLTEAFQDADRLVALRPASPTAYICRARWHMEVGQDEAALSDLNKVVETGEPYFLDSALFYLSIVLSNLGRYEEAEKICEALPSDIKDHIETPLTSRVITTDQLRTLIHDRAKI